MSRGIIDRITNRDLVSQLQTKVETLDKIISMQSEALDEFNEKVDQLADSLGTLEKLAGRGRKEREEKQEK